MRRLAIMLVVVTICLTTAPPATAGWHTASGDVAYVHRLLDGTSLSGFLRTANSAGRDPWYDWATDWCSAPLVGSTGRSFDFRASCRRHDFGYRNLNRIENRYRVDAWNATSRKWVDGRFLADMKAHCAGRSVLLRPTCYNWAYTFYWAVRLRGGP